MIIPHRPIDYYREYHVSVWVGQFPSVEAVDAYFTEDYGPEHWEPSPFAAQLGLGYYPPPYLELHFDEEMVPRPLLTFLMEATFSESFLHDALAAARALGIYEAQGIALLYNFDYQSKPNWQQTVGPMRFLGVFTFAAGSLEAKYHEMAEQAGCSVAALFFVLAAFNQFLWERRQEQDKQGHASARDFCDFLQCAQVKTTAEIFKWWIPRRIADELLKPQGNREVREPLQRQRFGASQLGEQSHCPEEENRDDHAIQDAEKLGWSSILQRLFQKGWLTRACLSIFPKETADSRVSIRHLGRDPQVEHVHAEETEKENSGAADQRSVATILRELGLLRSEDVGRIIFALVGARLIRTQESDSKADFHGLFNLEE